MKDFTKQQKIIKVGNSYAVTLDSKFVHANNLKAGNKIVGSYAQTHVAYAAPAPEVLTLNDVAINKAQKSKKLSSAEKKAVLHSKITPNFVSWVDKTLEEDKDILEKLANI